MALALTLETVIPSVAFENNFPSTISLADQTATTTVASTAVQNLGAPMTRFRVIIYVKTLVRGNTTTGRAGPVFYVSAADDSGFTTNLTDIGCTEVANVASATSPSCVQIRGCVPVAGKQYIKITCDPTAMGGGASSIMYDAFILATP